MCSELGRPETTTVLRLGFSCKYLTGTAFLWFHILTINMVSLIVDREIDFIFFFNLYMILDHLCICCNGLDPADLSCEVLV